MESLVQQLFGIDPNMHMGNSSVAHALNTTMSQAQAPASSVTPTSLISLLLALSALWDWLKLIILGSILETCRQFSCSIWSSIVKSVFITAQFKENDKSFNRMLVWLSKHPSWSTSFLSVS